MATRWLLAAVCLASCATGETLPVREARAAAASEPDASTPTPVDAPAALPPPDVAAPAPVAGAPSPGHGMVASPLVPGRYATDVHYHQESACSQSWESYFAHGTLILELAPGGVATACRGKTMHEAGPDFRMDMRERQGFAGTWRRDGAWVDVVLALADTPDCPQQRGYTNLEPSPWHLRCTALAPAPGGTSPLAVPVVGCQFADRVYTEELGYVVQSLLDGEWVLLSDGDGLRVDSDQPEPWGDVQYTVAPSPTSIDARAFPLP